MPNYQPNYIYSPLYGSRYMGGSRTPAPSTGSAGQVDKSAVQGRSNTIGVPYYNLPEEEQGPIGWSGTGRDQSAVESLSSFGFRPLDTLQKDPFEETGYFTTNVETTETTIPVDNTVPETDAPPVNFSGDGGDYGTSMYTQGQGILPSSSNNIIPNEMDLAWALYGMENNIPDFMKPFIPGGYLSDVGKYLLDKQIDNIDKSYSFMSKPAPEGMKIASDASGNTYYVWDEDNPYADSGLTANQFAELQSRDDVTINGLDPQGNINVTVTNPDGSTYEARAGVSPNTGLVNTYNFNLDDTSYVPELGDQGDAPPQQDLSTTISLSDMLSDVGLDEDGNDPDEAVDTGNDFGMSDAEQEAQDQNDQDEREDLSGGWQDDDPYWSAGGKVTGMLSKDPFEGYFS